MPAMVVTVPRSNSAARSGSSSSRRSSRRSTAEASAEAASGSALGCSTQAAGGARRWSDPGACAALCQLILDDRRGEPSAGRHRRRPLPPALYAENVAPFLRFDSPLPNMLYAFGGRNQGQGPLDTVEMFDTWHGEWVPCASMPTRRAGSAASLLPDGRMIVVGGYNENGIAEGLIATCDVYNPSLQCWEKNGAAPLARARWGHGCATLGNYVYVVGGCSLQPNAQPQEAFMETLKCCEIYHPEENRWSACAPLQIARSGVRVVALGGDRYLAAIGGCDDVFGRAETQPTVELFDTVIGQWTLLGPRLINPRTTAAAAAIGDGRLLVVGGAPSLSSAEVYQVRLPDEERSEDEDEVLPVEVEDMPEGRMGCQAAVVDLPQPGGSYPLSTRRCAVIVGGERSDEGGDSFPRVRQFSSVPVFDIETGTWREDMIVPAMPKARTAVALCVGFGRVAQTASSNLRGLGA